MPTTLGCVDSAYAKLERGRWHFNQLADDVKAFRARDPFAFDFKQSDHPIDPTNRIVITHRVRCRESTPPEWSLTVGDILTNLRAALDHAVFGHAATRQPLTPKQEKRLGFPLLEKSGEWPKCHNFLAPLLDPKVLHVIEQHQPYQSGLDMDWDGLHNLNELVNRDKHRAVRVICHSFEELSITNTGGVRVLESRAQPQEMMDGKVVGIVQLQRPAKFGPKGFDVLPYSVEFGYIEVIELHPSGKQRSVLEVMEALVSEVEAVLDALKAAGC